MQKKTESLRAWCLQYRGVQQIIAGFFGVTVSHVGHVLNSRVYSNRGQIEGVLADLGAPGMREREKEAKAKAAREITKTDREKRRLMEQLRKIMASKQRAA